MDPIRAPVSAGELFDKIAILRIKAERVPDPGRRALVERELSELIAVRDEAFPHGVDPALDPLLSELFAVNEDIWNIEDRVRLCEREGDFGPAFVELARSVYRRNDRRAALKRAINELTGSGIVEVKHFTAGAAAG
jgi:hypothetical protein